MKDLMMGHGASYPAPAAAPSAPALMPGLAPQTMARIHREARSMQLTPDQLVDRALIALADEVDAARCARRAAGEVLSTGDCQR